jgi:alkyl sulfatase BDS1-like metallo-beta-lactamase superfamily hydrolase
MIVENAVLHAFPNKLESDPDVQLSLSSLDFKYMMTGLVAAADLVADNRLLLEGDAARLLEFSALLDRFNQHFPIVTPREV